MNPILDFFSAILALAFRIVTSPLVVLLYCISGLLLTMQLVHKWTGHLSFSFARMRKISFTSPFTRHFHLSRH
jgi:hypothetical protein